MYLGRWCREGVPRRGDVPREVKVYIGRWCREVYLYSHARLWSTVVHDCSIVM